MIKNIDDLKLPTWVWRYFSTGDSVQMAHLVLKTKQKFVLDQIYFVNLGLNEFEIDNRHAGMWHSEVSKNSEMKDYIYNHQTIKAIFNKTVIR